MLARFHFVTDSQHKDLGRRSRGFQIHADQVGGRAGRYFRLDCDTRSDLARGNYGSHPFTRVGITVWPGHKVASSQKPETGEDGVLWYGRLLLRGRGPAGPRNVSEERYLITTCQIDEQNTQCFLDQFVTARSYLMCQSGFIRHHLFESQQPRTAIRFINIAIWRSMSDFVNAFLSPDFKKLISGGYDHTSQIIVARRVPLSGPRHGATSGRAA